MNPAAAHYREPVITECQTGDRLRYGKPTARFSCKCGFAYVRTGPDSSPEDSFRIGRIISFGPTWEGKLRQLWQDSSLYINEIGRRLDVDPLTVRRHAARLKLPLSRSDKRLKPLNRATQLKGKATSAAWKKKRRDYRSKWLSARKQGQQMTLKTLRRKLPREYAWLAHNDYEWLGRHKPHPQRHNISTTSVDWEKRDADYSFAVRVAALRLNNGSGRPVRVTKTAIGRVLGATSLLSQKLSHMPKTFKVLADVLETREEYAVKRVLWVASLYLHEQVKPREWQLILRASIYSLRNTPAVKCAINDSLVMLGSELELKKRA